MIGFDDFIESLLIRLPPLPRKVFLLDNLKSHYSDRELRMMYNAGHSVVFPLAYYPVDGPIEYIFNRV